MTETEHEWEAWTMGHSLWMLASTTAAWLTGEPMIAAGGGVVSTLLLVALGHHRWTERGGHGGLQKNDFGLANAVTLLRLAAIAVVASLRPAGPTSALLVFGILALDGIDGWAARRLGTASAFGAKFDMETDALLIAVLGVVLAVDHRLGAWVVIPGLLRYAYAVVIRVAHARGEAPRSRFGRYVFAILATSLGASLWPVSPIHRFAAAAASLLTIYSFARSTYWSFRGARAKRRPQHSMKARAFWIVGRGRGEIREEALRDAGEGEVLVQATYGAVSRGTELLVFEGRVPESEYERMRAPFQVGHFPCPVKYGYSSVGRVLRGPENLVGKSVFCLYPHQTHYVVPASAVLPLPEGVPENRAVLAANLETALNGLWDAGVSAGDWVAVVGAGVVGCLVAYLAAQCPGAVVELVDVDPSKAPVAKALGAEFKLPGDTTGDADVVIHASGSPEGLRTALSLAGTEAAVVELSWFGASNVVLPLGEAFHSKRLRLHSSQVGTVPATRRARWTNRRRLGAALGLLSDARLDALVAGDSRFDDLPTAMLELSREEAAKSLCRRIDYG